MIDLDITKILADRMAAQYPGVYVGSPLAPDSIVLPAILFEIDSDVVVGSSLQRANLKVSVQSSADDSTADAHALFARSVDVFLRAQTINEGGLYMWQPVPARTSNAVGDRHWETAIEYILGLEAL
jgi:hypothetical protein